MVLVVIPRGSRGWIYASISTIFLRQLFAPKLMNRQRCTTADRDRTRLTQTTIPNPYYNKSYSISNPIVIKPVLNWSLFCQKLGLSNKKFLHEKLECLEVIKHEFLSETFWVVLALEKKVYFENYFVLKNNFLFLDVSNTIKKIIYSMWW